MAARWGREVTTVRQAWSELLAKRSPRVLAVGIVLALIARVAYGDPGWADAAAAAAMVALYPFGEWAIHVHLLHLPPFRWRGRTIELVTTRGHMAHHRQPRDLDLIVLGTVETLALLALAVPLAVALLASPVWLLGGSVPTGPLLTGLLTGYVLIGVYEWTHFLIHTAHRPRSRIYRAVWRTHRLHHFKNERYWHGITSTVADRVLGTAPDHRDVPRSPTARALHGPR